MKKLCKLTAIATIMLSALACMPSAVTAATEQASVIQRESWRTDETSTYPLQYNVQYFSNSTIQLDMTTRDRVWYDKTDSMGTIQFDDRYYAVDFTNADGSSLKAIAVLWQYTDTGIEYEFVKNFVGSNWDAGTTFVITFTKKENAEGSSSVTAFGHELKSTVNESKQTAEERIAELEAELASKDELIQIARDKLAEMQAELEIKNQMLADKTTENSVVADINGDGVVNVIDLIALKKLLMKGSIA